MGESVRCLVAGCLGAAVVLLGGWPALGQAPQAANPNVYINPFAAGVRFPGAVAVGQPQPQPQVGAAGAGRLAYGSLAPGLGSPDGAYGSLSASYANPSLGYGSLMNSNYNNGGYGGLTGYGMYGTQWMMNPYQGYLSGAADVTRANAEYYLTIQQAKLSREEARRSYLQTRRAAIEEAAWEREHMPDPEKLRQKAIERELARARYSPPLTEIWGAVSLNALVHELIAQQGRGGRGPNVPLSEDIRDHINFRVGNMRGSVGLLKGGGELTWPHSLRKEDFKDLRENLNTLMKTAYTSVASDNRPDSRTISDLQAGYKKLAEAIDASVNKMDFNESLEAKHYLNDIKGAIEALKQPSVRLIFDKSWKSNVRNVAELVKFMGENGVDFAPATNADESSYVALYHALAEFDRGMQRTVSAEGER
jgi:soluble cytochrome b562